MLFRLFMFGLLIVLLFRLIRYLFGTFLSSFILHDSTDTRGRTQKDPPPELDETQIQDAEFRDLEN